MNWDLLIAHPPCTFLSNSGVKHLYIGGRKANGRNEQRWRDMRDAAEFYLMFRRADVPMKAIENPIMHSHAAELIGQRATQFVQPWWFGEPFFKATGFELHGLPALKATNRLTPPKPRTDEHKAWSAVHREPPGPNRKNNRSRTYAGVAEAMAAQWGEIDMALAKSA